MAQGRRAARATELRQFLAAPLIAEDMGYNVFMDTSVELNNYVYRSLQDWGLSPKKGKYEEKVSPSAQDAIYNTDELLIRELIAEYFDRNLTLEHPSLVWSDAATIAVRNELPGNFCRCELNSFVHKRVTELGLSPIKGRHGSEVSFTSVLPEEGGVYPENCPLIQRLVSEFFTGFRGVAALVEKGTRLYAMRVSTFAN